jgi:hypothetical protein
MIYESGHRTALVRLENRMRRSVPAAGAEMVLSAARRRSNSAACHLGGGRLATDRAGHGRQRTIVVATTVTC